MVLPISMPLWIEAPHKLPLLAEYMTVHYTHCSIFSLVPLMVSRDNILTNNFTTIHFCFSFMTPISRQITRLRNLVSSHLLRCFGSNICKKILCMYCKDKPMVEKHLSKIFEEHKGSPMEISSPSVPCVTP